MSQTITEQVAAMNEQVAGQLPADVLETFGREQAELDAAGVPAGVPEPGAVMPDGALLDAHGTQSSLAQARGGAAAVVVFYRGSWCPYCNLTLRTYQQQVQPRLAERGIKLIAVSPQRPDGSLTMSETNELTFDVLSDPGNQIAGQLGIVSEPGEDVRSSQDKLGVDVAAGNADGTAAVPMPTTVLVGTDGTIRWIDVHPNYTTRTEPTDLLAAVSRHLG